MDLYETKLILITLMILKAVADKNPKKYTYYFKMYLMAKSIKLMVVMPFVKNLYLLLFKKRY